MDTIQVTRRDNTENGVIINPDLAVGLRIPKSIDQPTNFLFSIKKYKDLYNDIYKQMEVANKLYKFNGIVGNAVDILVDFAITKVRPEPTGNKRLDKILNWWFEGVNSENNNSLPGMYDLCQEIGLEWFTSGNAFPYVKWENVNIPKIRGTVKVPYTINLLNPQAIEIPDGPVAFGQKSIYLRYDSELINKILSDGRTDPESSFIKSSVPRSLINSIQNNQHYGGIRLNPKYVFHIKRKSKSYQPWGTPYLSRAFSSVSLLEKMRQLDESITSGLLNLVTIFKIGTEEHPASNARLRKFAALLANPTATKTLVWAHDVEVEQVGPDGKVLQFKNKYDDCREELLISLGIPRSLMSLDSSGDAWVSVLSLVEKLQNFRNSVSLWIEKICNQIAEYNGYSGTKVKAKWERMNLADESSVKNLILSFYDRGLISIQTALKESGRDYEKEKAAKEAEIEDRELFMHPELPFSGEKEVEKTNPGKESQKDDTKTDQTVDMKEVKNKKPSRNKNA